MSFSLQTTTAVMYGSAGLAVAVAPTFWTTLLANGNASQVSPAAVAASQGLGLQAMTVAWLYGTVKMTPTALKGFAAMMTPFFAWDIYWATTGGLSPGIWLDFIANIGWTVSALYSAKQLEKEEEEQKKKK